MNMTREHDRLTPQSGVTLIELIVTIVVLGVALTGVLMAMQFTTRHSADPMIAHQAAAIADSYLEEVLLRAYADPDGNGTGEVRSTFDDVDDYDGLLDNGVRDQQNSPVSGLENYSVSVAVNATTVGPPGDTVPTRKVSVTVTHPAGVSFEVSGHRTEY